VFHTGDGSGSSRRCSTNPRLPFRAARAGRHARSTWCPVDVRQRLVARHADVGQTRCRTRTRSMSIRVPSRRARRCIRVRFAFGTTIDGHATSDEQTDHAGEMRSDPVRIQSRQRRSPWGGGADRARQGRRGWYIQGVMLGTHGQDDDQVSFYRRTRRVLPSAARGSSRARSALPGDTRDGGPGGGGPC